MSTTEIINKALAVMDSQVEKVDNYNERVKAEYSLL